MGAEDVAALEQQLRDLAVMDGDAAEVLTALAEAVFPGGTNLGDEAWILWPEPSRAAPRRRSPGAGTQGPRDLEAQIRKSEARFRSLVEQLPAVVFYAALGDEENEVYVSPQIESLLGFTQEEWLTNPLLWYSQLHPDDQDTVIEAFTKGVQTGQPFRAQVRFFSRTGEEVWILGEARLIRDEAQRPAYFQGVAFDVTITKRAQEMIAQVERARAESAQQRAENFAAHNVHLRQLNRELRAAKEAAEAAANARSTFLATMSHELRTPLNSIIVLAGLLADESLTADQQDMVRQLRLSSDHLLDLINDVLEFSRLRAGQVELHSAAFDLPAWLDDTLDIVAPRAAEKGLDLRLAVVSEVPRKVVADHGRLRQVLLNLLSNAVKFTAAGHIEVRLEGRTLDDGRWEMRCAVADTGMGIRADDAVMLFDEFRQADSGISREFGGTGLGLSISKRLCELLGGRIWVEPSAGPGTTMAFTWTAEADGDALVGPLSRAATAAPGVDGYAGHGAGRGSQPKNGEVPTGQLRILVAEDNQMNQQVAMLLLAAMGHQPDVVANGDQAIAAVGAVDYDVVLMDVAMPGTDGLSATRAIRALGSAVHQPEIVALTAHAFPGDAESCLEAGMNDYLTKPIDRDRLAQALAMAAQRAGRAVPGAGAAAGRPEVPAGSSAADGGSPGTDPQADAADFDPSLASAILDDFGRQPLEDLIALFRSEATRLLEATRAAVAAGDVRGAEIAAHTLKSGAANLGARGLFETCSHLERSTRAGSLEGAGDLVAAMGRQLAGALVGLDALSQRLTTSAG